MAVDATDATIIAWANTGIAAASIGECPVCMLVDVPYAQHTAYFVLLLLYTTAPNLRC